MDALEVKASEIAKEKGISKVHIFATINPDNGQVVHAFLSEPNFATKLRTMDFMTRAGGGIFSAAEQLCEAVLIKDHSHPLTYGAGSECDKFKLGVITKCTELIEYTVDQYKKK